MIARNGEVYFLIQVLKKGVHMNHNYPLHIMETLRESRGLAYNDSSLDNDIQAMFPETVLETMLEHEGIIGYVYCILNLIEEIFKVKLISDGQEQPMEEFKQGLYNIFEARGLDDDAIEQMANAICEDIKLNS
jgi:hypothetical protein